MCLSLEKRKEPQGPLRVKRPDIFALNIRSGHCATLPATIPFPVAITG